MLPESAASAPHLCWVQGSRVWGDQSCGSSSLSRADLACSHTTGSKGQWLFWAQPGLRLPPEEGRPQWGSQPCSGLPPDLVSGSRVVLAASASGSEARPDGDLGLGLGCCPSRPQSRCGQPCSPTPRRTGLPFASHPDHTTPEVRVWGAHKAVLCRDCMGEQTGRAGVTAGPDLSHPISIHLPQEPEGEGACPAAGV